jgi:hypothetical protein
MTHNMFEKKKVFNSRIEETSELLISRLCVRDLKVKIKNRNVPIRVSHNHVLTDNHNST